MATLGTRTYSPGEVTIIMNGAIVKDWVSITWTRPNPRYTGTQGSDGELTRVENAGHQYVEGTLTLKQASSSNIAVNALFTSGVVGPLLVKDGSGTSIHSIPECTLSSLGDGGYAAEESDREYNFFGMMILDAPNGN